MELTGNTLEDLYIDWIRRNKESFLNFDNQELGVLSYLTDRELEDFLHLSFHTICMISALEVKMKGKDLHNMNIHLLQVFHDYKGETNKLIKVIKGNGYVVPGKETISQAKH